MWRSQLRTIMALLASSHFAATAHPQKLEKAAMPPSERNAPSLALSPAVIMIKTKPGGSSTHPLTITNLTYGKCRFVMEAFDVVVRDGTRVFVPAEETVGGIARSAIFNPPTVELSPGESAQVKVTLTVPPEPAVRAVAAVFHGQTALPGNGNLMVTGSLGTLITYSLSDKIAVRTGAPTVKPQTETSNLIVSEQLQNYGREPVVTKGTLAILKSSGELIGRVAIESHRLLPGEKFDTMVEYPHNIQRGRYHAIISFVHAGGVQSNSVEFQVQ
jgi:hypothetical protein